MTQKAKTNNEAAETIAEAEAVITSHISQDLRSAVLIVSLVLNLFVFTTWVALQLTPRYDAQIAGFLFG